MDDLVFEDRREAGKRLAAHLERYRRSASAVVLALPRGGVPVGYEVARALELPLDVFLVRKLGAPAQPELAIGAIASGGFRVLNDELIAKLGISGTDIDTAISRERSELRRRERIYRKYRPKVELQGRIVILVDDGLATGATIRAAIKAVRSKHPLRVVVAVPVAAPSARRELEDLVDDFVCVEEPRDFRAVGNWYWDFSQTRDEEVQALLAKQPARSGIALM